MDEEVEIHDSNYSFGRGSNNDERNDGTITHALLIVEGKAPQVDNDAEIQYDHGVFDELHSCSSMDSEELMPSIPKYSEFNEDIDMEDPQFKIGMKLRDLKEFKEAMKNYGIKNRYVMNFKPNTKTRCKTICKKRYPLYLWASPIVRGW